MIPMGTYKAKAIGGTYGESKKKGTPFVRASFAITDGEYQGHSVSWDGYFTQATKVRTIESLRFCGCAFPNDDITNLEGIDQNEVSIVVEHEKWTDERTGEEKTRARVAWVNGPGGIPEDQLMDDRKRAAFAANMKGAVIQAKQKAGIAASSPNGGARSPAPRQSGGASEQSADDIPF